MPLSWTRMVLCVLVFGCTGPLATAQTLSISGVAARVLSAQGDPTLPAYRPFTRRALDMATGRILPEATGLALDSRTIDDLLRERPEVLELLIPDRHGDVLLRLVPSGSLTDEFQVTIASTGGPVEVRPGLHYVGIVNNDPNTLAAISIFPGQVMGIVNDGQGDHVLGPLEGSDAHIYHATKQLPSHSFVCDTPEDAVPVVEEGVLEGGGERSLKCVRLYWEVNYDVFLAKGSVTNTVNYITALFNQSAALYANDGISVVLNQVFVWDVASPYVGTTMLEQLTYFQNTRNSFNGDLAHLLGLTGGGGRAASLAGLCNIDNDNSMAYSNITTTFLNVPTYSWSVQVVTHEQGHLLGSNHTHACVWNGNNTQIDGCGPTAGYTEGNTCATGPIPPSGGTIMSYCHLNAVGINFNNGFGPQPLAVMANSVSNAPCLIACTSVACGPVLGASAGNITSTTALLTWMPITNATSYTVQWKPVNSANWTAVPNIVGTSHPLSGLSPWTSYTFQVRTNCAAEVSAFSPLTTFTTAGNSLSDGSIACYPFNASPNDQSGNGHHGVLFGPLPTADRYGVPNAAYAFDGVDDRIDIPDLSTWAISNEISIGFWVKTMESKGNAVVWAWPDIGTDRLLVSPHFAHTGSNDFSWTLGNLATTGRSYITGYPFLSEWEHYVVTSSALSNSMKTYRNGVLIDEEQHAGSITNLDRTLCIGGNGSPIFFFHGSMDDLTFHRRELTAGEVLQLYTSGTPCAQRILVAPKVLLDGPYVEATQLMGDVLRNGGLIPSVEPYTGLGSALVAGGTGVAISAGVTGTTGPNAICDWVLVELRQPSAPHTVLATRTALVQRDGDVVNFDGASPIAFDAAQGNYRVAVRHRNHLGIMTGAAIALSSATVVVDLTDAGTLTYGLDARRQRGARMVCWPGDATGDGTVIYTGAGNDRDPVLQAIGGVVPTNTLPNVYDRRDVNLDGIVKYGGQDNDRDVILGTIGGVVPTAVRTEQLP